MKVLVINSGSSSIKYQLIDMTDESVMVSGLVERIGEEQGVLTSKTFPGTDREVKTKLEQPIPTHSEGLQLSIDLICTGENAVCTMDEIDVVGHRVVAGGEKFNHPVIITEDMWPDLTETERLAPLHNPANLGGAKDATKLFPNVPQVLVFDTAFHQTMPPHAYMYALPYEYYEEDHIRRYGAHGTSHKYVANECASLMDKKVEDMNLITIHMGNGASISAVKNGLCVDTSMGLTPLEGLVMGTRSGDVDPAVHNYLAVNRGLDIAAIDNILHKESGLKGLCGMNDMRDIHAAIEKGDERAQLALDVQTYRTRKYIGSYMAVLGSVDAIVFTAGIGENDDIVRAETFKGMEPFGMKIDTEINATRSKEARKISTEDSAVAIWVIPTNEELAIAREAMMLAK
ncbi:acetate kinase [Pseudodesulfovibrio thermohalotolerans]|uniref:acetate kinase n=1 Tax=Pseudodesulfovibrio thermohalotolerans TaxID=2880651 RepID=UPI002441BC2A|nr:acetate kinase [Pseudodesulfovibrio thermohalotolerans]WFS61428.1 acetate kinase [Pseudodesulfovibrio thermohalotolerans]